MAEAANDAMEQAHELESSRRPEAIGTVEIPAMYMMQSDGPQRAWPVCPPVMTT